MGVNPGTGSGLSDSRCIPEKDTPERSDQGPPWPLSQTRCFLPPPRTPTAPPRTPHDPAGNDDQNGTPVTDSPTHALYRFYGDDGALLYVGITLNPGARFHQHSADKPWWHEVRGITMETYPDRRSVLDAEARAIQVENPRYNIQRPRAHRASRPPRPQIVWLCQVCGQPIADGQGYLEVDLRLVYQIEQYWRDHDARQDPNSFSFDLSDFPNWPKPAPWCAHHGTCDPDPAYSGYWFNIERARTHAHLLSLTAHLMEKDWLEHTNWTDLIGRMAGVDA